VGLDGEEGILQHGQIREQVGDLKGAGEALGRAAMGGGAGHVSAEERDPARADRQRARDEIEQRGLPRAVGADERAALSRLHLEANAIHSAQTAEVPGHSLQPQRQHESSLALTELASPHPSPPEGERAG
jgi:hypothetical protein